VPRLRRSLAQRRLVVIKDRHFCQQCLDEKKQDAADSQVLAAAKETFLANVDDPELTAADTALRAEEGLSEFYQHFGGMRPFARKLARVYDKMFDRALNEGIAVSNAARMGKEMINLTLKVQQHQHQVEIDRMSEQQLDAEERKLKAQLVAELARSPAFGRMLEILSKANGGDVPGITRELLAQGVIEHVS